VDTFTTFSLTHEIESYQGRATLEQFINLLYRQLRVGGRWLNVDVVGPAERDDLVYLWLEQNHGRSDDHQAIYEASDRPRFKHYLSSLSVLGRFLRFVQDFRHEEGYQLHHELEIIDGETFAVLRCKMPVNS